MNTIVWRIIKAKFADNAFSGAGAKVDGGRWNRIGIPMVYTSGSVALATLEMRVHLTADDIPNPYRLIRVSVPDTLIVFSDPKELPRRRSETRSLSRARRIGTKWFRSGVSCVLRVPSAVVPQEFNYLINPTHPDFDRIEIGRPTKFQFDPRLFG